MGGGGSTTTSGIIPNELKALYRGSADALVGQQEANPLGQYNEANPLEVAGANPFQNMGASLIAGGAAPSGLDALALQSILRQPGLAGAGPTTGEYDYGREASLSDIGRFLNPTFGAGAGLEGFNMRNAAPAQGAPEGLGQTPTGPDYSGAPLGDFDARAERGMTGPLGGGAGGAGAPGAPGGAPGFAGLPAGMSLSDALAKGERLRGRSLGVGELNKELSGKGLSARFDTTDAGGGGRTGRLSLSGAGGGYENVGSQHEGAGPGGESQFLYKALGIDPGKLGDRAWGGEVGTLDRDIARARSIGMRAENLGLDPNTSSYEDVVKASLAQRGANPTPPSQAARKPVQGYNAKAKLTGKDRKPKAT